MSNSPRKQRKEGVCRVALVETYRYGAFLVVKPILWVMLIAVAVNATLTFRYFFVIPTAFAVLIAALIAATIGKTGSSARAGA